jgi:hypothetical protein
VGKLNAGQRPAGEHKHKQAYAESEGPRRGVACCLAGLNEVVLFAVERGFALWRLRRRCCTWSL